MPHSDAVVDGDGVELCGIAAELLYLLLYDLTYFVEMSVTRHKLRERVDDSDNGLAELLSLHAVSNPKRSCSSHSTAFSTDRTP